MGFKKVFVKLLQVIYVLKIEIIMYYITKIKNNYSYSKLSSYNKIIIK